MARAIHEDLRAPVGQLARSLAEARAHLEALPEHPELPHLIASLDAARICAERAAATVREIAPLATLETTPEAVDLRHVMDGALSLVGPALQPHAPVTRAYGPEVVVRGQDGRLTQVVMQLLLWAGDALRDGREGEGSLTVSVHVDGDRGVIELHDTSPTSLDDEVTVVARPRREERGLGIAMARAIVAAYGGTLTLDRRALRGTMAVLSLPVAAAVVAPTRESPTVRPPRVVDRKRAPEDDSHR